jgi:hypothetical protein
MIKLISENPKKGTAMVVDQRSFGSFTQHLQHVVKDIYQNSFGTYLRRLEGDRFEVAKEQPKPS